jgi:hypothetical protein
MQPIEVIMKTVALALALLVVPVGAQALPSITVPTTCPSRSRQLRRATQIACTQVGCLPGAPGLLPEGRTPFSGEPSGFDVMVCPSGTMYGHL